MSHGRLWLHLGRNKRDESRCAVALSTLQIDYDQLNLGRNARHGHLGLSLGSASIASSLPLL